VHESHRFALEVVLAVGVVESIRETGGDEQGQAERQPGSFLLERPQNRAQVPAVDVFHGDEVGTLDFAKIVDVNDVGVLQLRRYLGLVNEHPDELLVVGQVRENPFDGDDFLETLHALHAGAVDFRHPTGRDKLGQLVLAKRRPAGERFRRMLDLRGGDPGARCRFGRCLH
jgi:hypothetical protein